MALVLAQAQDCHSLSRKKEAVCENGEKGLRASCTRLPTIGSPHWVGEDRRGAEGGVASLSLASFWEEVGGWHLLVGISKGVQEKS